MNHAVLLGDSIFDNALYVPQGEPVIQQLRERLPRDWQATLLAVDGSVIAGVSNQVRELPEDATHLVVSTGGNDMLGFSALLEAPARSAAEVYRDLAEARDTFRTDYRAMLAVLRELRKPVLLCTVYDSIPGLTREAVAALSVFNDVILRVAIEARWPVLDLRAICSEARDYSSLSPIEPSEIGGAKIANAIAQALRSHDFRRTETVIYTTS